MTCAIVFFFFHDNLRKLRLKINVVLICFPWSSGLNKFSVHANIYSFQGLVKFVL